MTTTPGKESFKILDGETELFTSPNLEYHRIYEFENCFPENASHQYTILMLNSISHYSWAEGAWIKVEGINGNTVVKMMNTQDSGERIKFALYSPINKGSTWKYASGGTNGWTDVDFDDTYWSDVVTGTTSMTVTGPQYYRHAFAGISNMAAIEVQLNYRFGIVVFINGIEVHRNNMPAGVVTTETLADSAYDHVGYHGFIYPSEVAGNASSMLAVELHFTSLTHTEVIQFNGFLSFLSAISEERRCFVIPHDPEVTSVDVEDTSDAFNWTEHDWASIMKKDSYIVADYSNTTSFAAINGVSIYQWSSSFLKSFDIQGSMTSDGLFVDIFSFNNIQSKGGDWTEFTFISPVWQYPFIKFLNFREQISAYGIELGDIHFMVCNNHLPDSISFNQEKTTYLVTESISISPTDKQINNCHITPSLPTGLVWNTHSCSISGSATVPSNSTVYTVSITYLSRTIFGYISIEINDCDGDVYMMHRVYKWGASKEYLTIFDTDTKDTLFSIPSGHSHPDDSEIFHYLCIQNNRFYVEFFSTDNYWRSESYFYLYHILPFGEKEMIIKGRYDNRIQVPTKRFIRRPHVRGCDHWYYKFDSIPNRWYSSDTTNWHVSNCGGFPQAINRIQLFKKSFDIGNIMEVRGLILSIRYEYGCIVYINEHEVWRNGVEGGIHAPMVTNSYTALKYRVVTLSGVLPSLSSIRSTSTRYLNEGTNIIAIALIAPDISNPVVSFDAIVRLMEMEQPESHIWNIQEETQSMSMDISPFSQDERGGLHNYGHSWTGNSLEITLDDDRREWVSSMHIQNSHHTDWEPIRFNVYGREKPDDEWILLREVTNMTWTSSYEKKYFLFQNTLSFNQFRFENIYPKEKPHNSYWELTSLDLYADNVMNQIPLSYPSVIDVKTGIEMTAVIPSGDGYFDFDIAPPLPPGLLFNNMTGGISGTPTKDSSAVYTVTAKSIDGGVDSSVFLLTISSCSEDQLPVTLRFFTDNNPGANSWKLYEGRGTSGTVVWDEGPLPVTNDYYYADLCLVNGMYTFEGTSTSGSGWGYNTGYTLIVDSGQMEIDVMEMAAGETPIKVTSVFSTFLPFRSRYTEWKMNQNDWTPSWETVGFDDSTWETVDTGSIPPTTSRTTYMRRSFSLSNTSDYHVLNVQLRFDGGVAGYFNGKLVARFNLPSTFDETTKPLSIHDGSKFSRFHVILDAVGCREGENVMAFEIHRPDSPTTTEVHPVVFDATGVFGVEDCSTVLDTYSSLQSSPLIEGTLENIMDLDPHTTGTLPNTANTYVDWVVENMEGSMWNALNMYTSNTRSSFGFAIHGFSNPDDPSSLFVTVLDQQDTTIEGRVRYNLDSHLALVGYQRYRWILQTPSPDNTSMNTLFMAYCKPTGSVCQAVDNYPPVAEGQISPASCPYDYGGYSYRECSGGQLGEVKLDRCQLMPPFNPKYSQQVYLFTITMPSSTGVPSVYYSVSRWYFNQTSTSLPEGLVLNEQTGEISGTPMATIVRTEIGICAENQAGFACTTIFLSVEAGFSYPLSPYVAQKGVQTTIRPHITIEVNQFAIGTGSLPLGLTLNPVTGEIAGTPVEVTDEDGNLITVRATNAMGMAESTLVIQVFDVPNDLSYPHTAYILPLHESFSITPSVDGSGITFSIQSGTLPQGLSIDQLTGVISGTPVEAVHDRSIVVTARNDFGSAATSILFNIQRAPKSFSYAKPEFAVEAGEEFSQTPSITGDFITFSVIQGTLPSGLLLDESTGRIWGTIPYQYHRISITVLASNLIGEVSADVHILILTMPAHLHYADSTLFFPINNMASFTPSVDGNELIFSVYPPLPSGLSINAFGTIAGVSSTPTDLILYTVTASNQLGSTTTTIPIQVLTPPSDVIYSNSRYVIFLADKFSITPVFKGEDVRFSLISCPLPSGLELDRETGTISGSPREIGNFEGIEIQAKNGVGSCVTILSLEIKEHSHNNYMTLYLWGVVLTVLITLALVLLYSKCRRRNVVELPLTGGH